MHLSVKVIMPFYSLNFTQKFTQNQTGRTYIGESWGFLKLAIQQFELNRE